MRGWNAPLRPLADVGQGVDSSPYMYNFWFSPVWTSRADCAYLCAR